MQNPETGEMRLLMAEEFRAMAAREVAGKLGFPADSPMFHEGEVLKIKTGYWRILELMPGRMMLKSVSAGEAAKEKKT